MAPHQLSSRLQHKFFSDKSIDIFDIAPIQLNVYMTGNRFENIIAGISFTGPPSTYLKEKFFEVIQMIVEYNDHMKDV